MGWNLLEKPRRREGRRVRASARMAGASEAADRRASAGALDARPLFPRVADAIEALPDGEREALPLFAREDLSDPGGAEVLELAIRPGRSRLNRPRTALRGPLDPGGQKW